MSFFDEGDDEAPARATRDPRPPRPRRPATARTGARRPDRQTLLVRRGVAGGIGLVLVFVIVLGISSCERSARRSALRAYADNVTSIAQDSDQNVGARFFADLAGARSQNALDLEQELNQLRLMAQSDATRAQGLSVPGDMDGAQRDLLLTLDFRTEAVGAVANLITAAIGGQNAAQAIAQIAGQMEKALASDVTYSQRVQPLIEQVLARDGIQGETVGSSRWVHDIGWLSTSFVQERLTGVTGTGTNGSALAAGTHGHLLAGVSVGSNTLTAGGALNTIASGANPTFTVQVDNDSQNAAANVKVDVSVTAEGKVRRASHIVAQTHPGQTVPVDVPITGVPLGVPATVTADIEAVPGEKNVANNKNTYTAVFTH